MRRRLNLTIHWRAEPTVKGSLKTSTAIVSENLGACYIGYIRYIGTWAPATATGERSAAGWEGVWSVGRADGSVGRMGRSVGRGAPRPATQLPIGASAPSYKEALCAAKLTPPPR